MHDYNLINLRYLGFQSFLADDEGIVDTFRTPFLFALNRMIFRFALWGGLTAGLWFFLPPQYFPIWVIAGAFCIYKVFGVFANWYVNAILMTSESLIFVEWHQFFKRKSTRLDFWDMDEIEVERMGISSFLYNYGTLRFQRYGGELQAMHKVSRPGRAAKIIEAYREQFLDAKNFTEQTALKELISNMVQTHVREHGQPEREKRQGTRDEGQAKKKEERREKKEVKKSIVSKIFKADEMPIEVEKQLDDEGGIEIDLQDK